MAKEMMKPNDNTASIKEIDTMKTKVDVNAIRDDLELLRDDAKSAREHAYLLAKDVKAEGRRQLTKAEERAIEAYENARERGQGQYEELTSYIQENPGQSLAIAFVGGILASMLLRRR